MLGRMRMTLILGLVLLVGCPKQETDPKKIEPQKMEIRE